LLEYRKAIIALLHHPENFHGKKKMENKIIQLEILIKEELEYLDHGSFKNKKYNTLQKCDIELFSLKTFVEKEKYGTALYFMKEKAVELMNIHDLFKKKETGERARELVKEIIQSIIDKLQVK
jgi:ribonuclease HIII